MNRAPATLLRISVGLLGLLFVVVGLAPFFWHLDVAPVKGWIDRLDPSALARWAAQEWWPAVLVGILLVGLIWGWALIAALFRPGKIDVVELAGSGRDGVFTVAPKLIAQAVEEELRADPIFDRVDVAATDDRGHKLIRIEVSAPADRSYDDVVSAIEPAMHQIEGAVAGSDLHVQAFIDLERTTAERAG